MRSMLILCRHGNTFAAGEKVVMVGAREDLPLTDFGRSQARALARALVESRISLGRVITGPLARTREFAAIVLEELGESIAPRIDERLIELDYGAWGGLSDDEIAALSGSDALKAWRERSVRPSGITFQPSEARLLDEARTLLDELSIEDSASLLVSSNGRLRAFRSLVSGGEQGDGKVKTGNSCVLIREGGSWRVAAWDCEPGQLAQVLRGEISS